MHPAEGPLDGRADPAVRGRDAGAGAAGAAAGLQPAAGVVPRQPPGPGGAGVALAGAGPRRAPAAVAAARAPDEEAARAHARRDRVPLRLRRPRAVASAPRRSPYVFDCDGAAADASAIVPGESDSACSAATPTGAGRSGSRSTTCSIESLQKFHHYYGDDFKVECPTGSGQSRDASSRSPTSCRGG